MKKKYLYDLVVEGWYPWLPKTLFIDHIMIKANNWNDALNQFEKNYTDDYYEDCWEIKSIDLVWDYSKGEF